MRDNPLRIISFAAAVCIVCSIVVSMSAVALRDRQDDNRVLDRQKRVLIAAGLLAEGEALARDEVEALFAQRVKTLRIELSSGREVAQDADAEARKAPDNDAGIVQLPVYLDVYLARTSDAAQTLVLPIEGKGLWSTMKGYLALDAKDLDTVRGIEFYAHGETPGLGGEIDNPRWKDRFKNRRAFDDRGFPALAVARTAVGSPEEAPHEVDALTGATLTARGVTHMIAFWLGEHGFGPLLKRLREEGPR